MRGATAVHGKQIEGAYQNGHRGEVPCREFRAEAIVGSGHATPPSHADPRGHGSSRLGLEAGKGGLGGRTTRRRVRNRARKRDGAASATRRSRRAHQAGPRPVPGSRSRRFHPGPVLHRGRQACQPEVRADAAGACRAVGESPGPAGRIQLRRGTPCSGGPLRPGRDQLHGEDPDTPVGVCLWIDAGRRRLRTRRRRDSQGPPCGNRPPCRGAAGGDEVGRQGSIRRRPLRVPLRSGRSDARRRPDPEATDVPRHRLLPHPGHDAGGQDRRSGRRLHRRGSRCRGPQRPTPGEAATQRDGRTRLRRTGRSGPGCHQGPRTSLLVGGRLRRPRPGP